MPTKVKMPFVCLYCGTIADIQGNVIQKVRPGTNPCANALHRWGELSEARSKRAKHAVETYRMNHPVHGH